MWMHQCRARQVAARRAVIDRPSGRFLTGAVLMTR
jgi:hypothetical protein